MPSIEATSSRPCARLCLPGLLELKLLLFCQEANRTGSCVCPSALQPQKAPHKRHLRCCQAPAARQGCLPLKTQIQLKLHAGQAT